MATIKESIKTLLSHKDNLIADLKKQADKLIKQKDQLQEKISVLNDTYITPQDYINIIHGYIEEHNKAFVNHLCGSQGYNMPNHKDNGLMLSEPTFSKANETPLRVKTILSLACLRNASSFGFMPEFMCYLLEDELKNGVAKMVNEICSRFPDSFNSSNRTMSEIRADISLLEDQINAIDEQLSDISDQARSLGEEL